MESLLTQVVSCPYCGEQIDLLIDTSAGSQDTIEDCQVCCRPIRVKTDITHDDQIQVHVYHENE